MVGSKFEKLTVISLDRVDSNYNKHWACVCECGGLKTVRQDRLTSGHTKSCGCLQTAYKKALQVTATTEDRRYTRNSYRAMISRCYRPSMGSYPKYGAKGVVVCDRWRFGEGGVNGWTCFFMDMGPRPRGYTLDRVDGTKGYYPENCRWATLSQQSSNRVYQSKVDPNLP